jgi:hypothetical protein
VFFLKSSFSSLRFILASSSPLLLRILTTDYSQDLPPTRSNSETSVVSVPFLLLMLFYDFIIVAVVVDVKVVVSAIKVNALKMWLSLFVVVAAVVVVVSIIQCVSSI